MSDFPEVRRALDTLTVPPLPSVDLSAIYRDALDTQARTARRWKLTAVGVAALAASIVLVLMLPKVEIRLNSQEFSIRWGQPPAPVVPAPPTADPRIRELIDEQQKLLLLLRDSNARQADLQDLIVTVARDVADRDTGRKQELLALAEKLREFEAVTARQFQDSERTNTALYNAVFAAKPKGDSP